MPNFDGDYHAFFNAILQGRLARQLHEVDGDWEDYNVKVPRITDPPFSAVAGGSMSTEQRTANTQGIQAAINSLLGDQAQSSIAGRGGKLLIPPGVFEINGTVGLDVSLDFQAGVIIEGGGGRLASVIRQVDDSIPCFQIKGSTQNVRGVELRNLTLRGGSVGLWTENDNYSLFDNVCFYQQAEHAVRCNVLGGFGSLFNNCWFSHSNGNTLKLVTGQCWMVGCTIGESSGAFEIGGGQLTLESCLVFDSQDKLSIDTGGTGSPLFYMTSGAGLRIKGGRVHPGPGCQTVIYCTHSRDILIDGTDLILHDGVTDLLVDYQASNGPKPFAVCALRPALISSANLDGLRVYRERTGNAAWCHRNAVVDTIVEYQGAVLPYADEAFLTESNGNQLNLRPRLNLSL